MQEKPVVIYNPKVLFTHIEEGTSAYVFPLDHPSSLVSNTAVVRTSKVISYNKETGEFETMNTKYVPLSRRII
jgi:hypothetical protein